MYHRFIPIAGLVLALSTSLTGCVGFGVQRCSCDKMKSCHCGDSKSCNCGAATPLTASPVISPNIPPATPVPIQGNSVPN